MYKINTISLLTAIFILSTTPALAQSYFGMSGSADINYEEQTADYSITGSYKSSGGAVTGLGFSGNEQGIEQANAFYNTDHFNASATYDLYEKSNTNVGIGFNYGYHTGSANIPLYDMDSSSVSYRYEDTRQMYQIETSPLTGDVSIEFKIEID